MLSNKISVLVFVLLSIVGGSIQAQRDLELETLFTTSQERQIIDSNRYRSAVQKTQKKQPTQETTETAAVRELVQEKVSQIYIISGITINEDGAGMAWVNNEFYENGATLESGSKLRINNGPVKSITIIAPDGKAYAGTSGETLTVTYMRAMEE
jgi:hypothetical protein